MKPMLPFVATVLVTLAIANESRGGLITTISRNYLVIATGEGTGQEDFESFNMSNVEIGADQEIVSNSSVGSPSQRVGGTGGFKGGLDLTGDFVPNDGENAKNGGNRWNDVDPDHGNDTVGIPDTLPGARPIFEGIDFSGNVALTGEYANFNSSNSDVNANLGTAMDPVGIHVNRSPGDAFPSPSDNNSFFHVSDPNTALNLNLLNGIAEYDPTDLLGELAGQRDFIVGLMSDQSFTSDIENTNIKDSGGVFTFDLDADDTNGDGFAVYDIDRDGNTFKINNSDVILESSQGTIAIFRMADGTQFNFSNSSILLGDGTTDSTDVISEIGGIFFQDAFKGTNELFNLSNVILGGVGLYDFTDFNPNRSLLLNSSASVFDPAIGDATVINLQDAQGCAQFIGHQVLMSNNRWTHCAAHGPPPGGEVPEPASVAVWGVGLVAFACATRPRRRKARLKSGDRS